jgi:hypothetical protein
MYLFTFINFKILNGGNLSPEDTAKTERLINACLNDSELIMKNFLDSRFPGFEPGDPFTYVSRLLASRNPDAIVRMYAFSEATYQCDNSTSNQVGIPPSVLILRIPKS